MEVRQEIISRSEQLFLRLGVRSVTMDDIARELGISKKTLYQHFDNKDTLVEEVISTHLEQKQDLMDHICESATDALDEIRSIGAFITATIEEVSASALYDLQKYYRKSWELLMQKQDSHKLTCIMKNIDRGVGEGLYRSDLQPEIVAKIYAKATALIVDEISNSASRFSRRQLIWELHNYHIHAIATEKGLKLWKEYSSEMKYFDIQK
jgi:TetR/AcrR family transcriptional regulator, cholesterol catabolism regulator